MRHLQTRAQFQALLRRRPVARTEHFMLHLVPLVQMQASDAALFPPADPLWVGALIPKRWARRAVRRNAIRRQIYSTLASALPETTAAALLVRLRAPFARDQYPSASSEALKRAIRHELLALLARAPLP